MKLTKIAVAWLLSSLSLISSVPTQAQPPLTSITPPQSTAPTSGIRPEVLQYNLDKGDVNQAVQQIEQGWKKQYESYFGAPLPSGSMTVAAIARTLDEISRKTGKRSALIYLLPLADELEIILIPAGGKPVHKRIQAANRDALFDVVQTFRREVSDGRKTRTRTYLAPAQQLYQWLIAPLDRELQVAKIDTLIFCAGSNLRSVPLAALHDGQKFLIEKYSLALIPAFNLLDPRYTDIRSAQVLAMGASQFRAQPALPAVPLELSAITGDLWQGKSFLNQGFTLTNLKSQRRTQPFEIVHLATHAEFLPGDPQESYIQFWDNRLLLNQLPDLGWRRSPVQLLVLSACITALGDQQAELGFAGLAVQSGARSAIASLWYVSDAGTLVLMTEFYRHLKTAPIKAEALRQTQIQMLKGQARLANTQNIALRGGGELPASLATFKNTNLSHPFYWAAFTLIGNPW